MSEEPQTVCDIHGIVAVIYQDYILPILYLTFALLMIYLIFMFIKTKIDHSLKLNLTIFYVTIIYFIVQLVTFILAGMGNKFECHNPKLKYLFINIIGNFCYIVQTYILIGLLFYKLYKTYSNVPSLAIKKSTIRLFIICYIMVIVIAILYRYAPHGLPSFIRILTLLCCGLLILVMVIWVFTLYLYKMCKIFKETQDDDLIHLILKTSLLAIISISFTMATWTAVGVLIFANSIHYTFIFNLIFINDIYTNALCIFLAYKRFENHYNILCGVCDRKCIRKCVQNKGLQNVELENIQSNTMIV